MKRITLLIFYLAQTALLSAQKTDEDAILYNFKKQEACWSAHDIDCYCEAYANLDSVRMIYRGGVVYGKKDISAFYKRYWNSSNMGSLKFDRLKLEPLSDEYYSVIGRYNVIRIDEIISGYFSVIMRKVAGEWKIYSDHSS